jgi:hypothetical protein
MTCQRIEGSESSNQSMTDWDVSVAICYRSLALNREALSVESFSRCGSPILPVTAPERRWFDRARAPITADSY